MDRQEVFTPLGRGHVVYQLKDGTLVVEFPHGGGKIFRPGELSLGSVRPRQARLQQVRETENGG